MKITKQALEKIIKEEIVNLLSEQWPKGARKRGKEEAPKIVHPANKTMPGEQWYETEDGENPYGERAKEARRDWAAEKKAELDLQEIDIANIRQKFGLPEVPDPSEEEMQSALAGEERPITWDTIQELMRRIDALELKVYKGVD
tara:strand:- start:307 stop:738 length:432 start_codon:yes stop_codon:yes gene_type:complete